MQLACLDSCKSKEIYMEYVVYMRVNVCACVRLHTPVKSMRCGPAAWFSENTAK